MYYLRAHNSNKSVYPIKRNPERNRLPFYIKKCPKYLQLTANIVKFWHWHNAKSDLHIHNIIGFFGILYRIFNFLMKHSIKSYPSNV